MSLITVNWVRDHHDQILMHFPTTCDWAEFHSTVAAAHTLARSVENEVYLIIWHQAHLPPGNLLGHFRQVFQDQPSNIKHIFIVVEAQETPFIMGFVRRLAMVTTRLFPYKSHITFADSLAEVELLLNQQAVH